MRRTETKERILAAAVEIIRSSGNEKMSLRQVAAMARANCAAVNYYFRTKEALLDAARAELSVGSPDA